MASEIVRLASSALSLRRFTKAELVDFCDVKLATVSSWLHRNNAFFDKRPAEDILIGQRPKGGRPPNRYILKPDAIARLKEQVAGAQALVEGTRRDGISPNLDNVDRQYQSWLAADDAQDSTAAEAFAGLRTQIRLAWEDLADMSRAGEEPPGDWLKRLADVEFRAGIAAPPDTGDLLVIGAWLAGRMKGMSSRGVPVAFSRRTMWIRTEARGVRVRSKIIAAALGAQVWADEGLESDLLTRLDLIQCAQVADEAPTSERLRGVAEAIDLKGFGFCKDAAEVQAVTRGLTARPLSATSDEVCNWIGTLPFKRYWTPHLAPVAFHLLAEASETQFQSLLSGLRADLENALAEAPAKAGRLREEALTYARYALAFQRSRRQAQTDTDRLLLAASSLSYVPEATASTI